MPGKPEGDSVLQAADCVTSAYTEQKNCSDTAVMKRTLIGMIEAGEPLMQQALDALRKHQQAEADGLPETEVNHLRLLADSLYQAVIDYQLVKAGQPPSTIH